MTGANSGMGFAIFQKLVENGLKVVAFDIKIDAIEDLKKKYKDTPIYARVCDITSDEAANAAFQWVNDNLGGCDIL